MSKHTQGPWHRNIKPASRYPVIFAGRNTHVAIVVSQGLTTDEAEANCDLIAAAPELYATLVEIEDLLKRHKAFQQGNDTVHYCAHKARAAINKAMGIYS